MKLENMEKANELSESIKRVDGKITELNHLNLTAEPDYTLTVGDGLFTGQVVSARHWPGKGRRNPKRVMGCLAENQSRLNG